MTEATPSKVELTLTPDASGSQLIINGMDISNKAYKVEIVAEVGKPTAVTVYMHLLDVTALGDTWVQYITTPRKARPVGDDEGTP